MDLLSMVLKCQSMRCCDLSPCTNWCSSMNSGTCGGRTGTEGGTQGASLVRASPCVHAHLASPLCHPSEQCCDGRIGRVLYSSSARSQQQQGDKQGGCHSKVMKHGAD
jgi:hypothetical protein